MQHLYGLSSTFLDDLNRVAVKNSPLRVLGLASNIVSFVPLRTTQIMGGLLNAVAITSTVVVRKSRNELSLRDADRINY